MVKVLVVRRVNPVVSEVVDQADLSADVVMTNSKHETPDGMVLSVYLVPAVKSVPLAVETRALSRSGVEG